MSNWLEPVAIMDCDLCTKSLGAKAQMLLLLQLPLLLVVAVLLPQVCAAKSAATPLQ
jgi:hypothetical protein